MATSTAFTPDGCAKLEGAMSIATANAVTPRRADMPRA
jgi:hypothetical protein